MAVSQETKEALIGAARSMDPSMFLYQLDLGGGSGVSYVDPVFEAACDVLAGMEIDEVDRFVARYQSAKGEQLASLIEADMKDNYVLAAIALEKLPQVDRSLPAVAWAAFNKHSYSGLNTIAKDRDSDAPGYEFALVRALAWAGFDIDAEEPGTGYTAMHYFASTKVNPYSNPRAVSWLIDRGADPDIPNKNGDSPIIYLAASVQWTDALTMSFNLLFNHPQVDRFRKANDGTMMMDLMMENDPKAPHPWRQTQIAKWKKFLLDQAAQKSKG